jgi:(1->4)-alpha-D-glucan 1-alpha-D-glucosylmutase
MRLNAPLRSEVPAESGDPSTIAPRPADELMLYQMLAGAWPLDLVIGDAAGLRAFADRIHGWQVKALREAKQVSDWVLPNTAYEQVCERFLYGVLEPKEDNLFLPQLAAWVERLTPVGIVNSLTQTVLRMTVPGVPDLYQGTDFWDFSLVDPDNRRPVDYASRERALKDAPALLEGASDWRSGRLKQQLIRQVLMLRAQQPELFSRGDYLPLPIEGPLANHAIAFLRRWQGRAVLVIASRLALPLLAADGGPIIAPQGWQEARVLLPAEAASHWKDVLGAGLLQTTASRLPLAEALARLPVAVLLAEAPAAQTPAAAA